jgi:hypothetical protein
MRIERNAIRLIMPVQVQDPSTGILLNTLSFPCFASVFHRSPLLAAAAEGSDSKLPAVKRKSISLSQRQAIA